MNLFNQLLVWLRLKCPCGGWLFLFKRYPVHIADVVFDDGTEKPLNIPMRPCKTCGMAEMAAPRTIKMKKGKAYVETVSSYQIRTYIDGEGDARKEA